MNPLAKASSSDLALINDSQRLAMSCATFLQKWNLDFTKRQMAALSAPRPAARVQPAAPVDWHEITIEVDRKWAAEYYRSLAAKVQSVSTQAIAQLPAKNHFDSYKRRALESREIKRKNDFEAIIGGLTQLYDNFNDPDVVAKPDPSLLAQLKSLRQECMKFGQDWQADYNITAGVGSVSRSANPYNIVDLRNSFDKERSAEFDKTIAPELTAWRMKVLTRDPSLDSHLDYKKVSSSLDVSAICSDVMNTGNGYRMKVIAILHKSQKP